MAKLMPPLWATIYSKNISRCLNVREELPSDQLYPDLIRTALNIVKIKRSLYVPPPKKIQCSEVW